MLMQESVQHKQTLFYFFPFYFLRNSEGEQTNYGSDKQKSSKELHKRRIRKD